MSVIKYTYYIFSNIIYYYLLLVDEKLIMIDKDKIEYMWNYSFKLF